MVERSRTHLVLIPSYNPGVKVFETVRGALRHWSPVWIVVDGSSDGTPAGLKALEEEEGGAVRVIVSERNNGKGAAVLHGCDLAAAEGFTHVLTMDSDGQHPPDKIPEFMAASARSGALVLGVPIFDSSAPSIRVQGRKISNWWANVETAGGNIGDSLYGFRVYPIADLVAVMRHQPWMRRFDFDPEAAVRLVWRGLTPVNIPAPVKYLRPEEGGVSHFNYLRDNVLLTWMHTRLVLESLVRLPWLLWRKAR